MNPFNYNSNIKKFNLNLNLNPLMWMYSRILPMGKADVWAILRRASAECDTVDFSNET